MAGHDKGDDYRNPEPWKTEHRKKFKTKKDALDHLDAGGHLEHADETLYRHMLESQRRLQIMCPMMLSVGLTAARENFQFDLSPEVDEALERSMQIAVRWLNPVTAEDTIKQIVADAQRVLKEMNPDNIAQAILGAAYLTLSLADMEKLKDPTAQCVLVSMAIVEEAKDDAANGDSTWGWTPGKAEGMVNKAVTKLGLMGYL